MPGSFSFDPYPVPLGTQAASIFVARYDRDAGSFAILPNLLCLQIDHRESDPSSAQFAYVLDSTLAQPPFPDSFAAVWPLDASGPYIVGPDDEIVVYTLDANARPVFLFDGFLCAPQVDLGADSQHATFTALGVEVRCWDTPVAGAIYRDSADTSSSGAYVQTGLPMRFNPYQQPNCTPTGEDYETGAGDFYPVFLSEKIQRSPDPRASWTLDGVARYLITQENDEVWVQNPVSVLQGLLVAITPVQGQTYDPTDPSTYDVSTIVIRDYDATGKAWAAVLAELCGYHGFATRFALSTSASGTPVTTLKIYRRDGMQTAAPKNVFLQELGATLDPGLSNTASMRLARDSHGLANLYVVVGAPVQYEVSVVLAPGFTIAAADASDANRPTFNRSALVNASADVRARYRVYVADEDGSGHWDYGTSATVTTPIDLSDAFGKPSDPKQPPLYVNRPRPGKARLITRDSGGRPRKAELAISRDYAGATPALWDGTGTWQSCGASGWRLLEDKLGVEIVCDNPEDWSIPSPEGASAKHNPSVKVRGITSQASPGTQQNTQRFFLRLTTVIEADACVAGSAARRVASPTKYAVTRRVDAADNYLKQVVDWSSLYNTTADPIVDRDDTDNADARAEALRARTEFPVLAGSVEIPSLSRAYAVGDRLALVDGIDVDLQTNAGVEGGELPYFPTIVARTWQFGDRVQKTILQLSDRRGEVERLGRARSRKTEPGTGALAASTSPPSPRGLQGPTAGLPPTPGYS